MNDLVFRELIKQAPTDSENVSQVIADYLQSIGDPKGELISLEHEINRMSNHPHKNLKQNKSKLARLEKSKRELIGNTKINLPFFLPQFYFNKNYDVVIGNPYAQAVHKLRRILEEENNQEHPYFKLDEKTSLYRPLTIEESVEARVVDYWTLKNPDGSKRNEEERLKLFNDYQDSCTSIAYKEDSTKFKIDPECEKLIRIEEDFNEPFFRVNYADSKGEELDSKDGIYNQGLSKSQYLVHPAHALAISDKTLRRAHADIVYGNNSDERKSGFYVLEENEIEQDQLRALYVYLLVSDSYVYGRFDLDGGAHFLRVAQQTP